MGTIEKQDVCPVCSKTSVEVKDEGLFCKTCGPVGGKETERHERVVHHEGFPHVVSEEPEP